MRGWNIPIRSTRGDWLSNIFFQPEHNYWVHRGLSTSDSEILKHIRWSARPYQAVQNRIILDERIVFKNWTCPRAEKWLNIIKIIILQIILPSSSSKRGRVERVPVIRTTTDNFHRGRRLPKNYKPNSVGRKTNITWPCSRRDGDRNCETT